MIQRTAAKKKAKKDNKPTADQFAFFYSEAAAGFTTSLRDETSRRFYVQKILLIHVYERSRKDFGLLGYFYIGR